MTRASLKLDGSERIDIAGISDNITPLAELACTIHRAHGARDTLKLLARLDTSHEVAYLRHGGLLHHVLRERLTA
jgi:aconitate hydratase